MTRLIETTICEQATVDTENGVIRGVKILGRESSNGRIYSPRAMESAARMYEGIGVNIDHTDRSQPDRERKLSEAFGYLENITRKPDGVYGDLHFLKAHPLSGQVVEAAQRMPNQLGLSHHAEGTVTRAGGKAVVEDIEQVFSVDLVRNPATNRGLFESEKPPMKRKVKAILAESYPKRYKSVAKLLREMDGPDEEPMANMEVEVPEEGTGDLEGQAKAAFRAMVMAAMDDDSLDSKATLAKVKEILAAQEKLIGGGGGSSAPAETTEEEEEDPKKDEEATESKKQKPSADPAVKRLVEQVARMERRQLVRDLLEEAGYTYRDLSPERRKLLAKIDDEEAVHDLIESWGPMPLNSRTAGHRQTVRESGDKNYKPAEDAKALAARLKKR